MLNTVSSVRDFRPRMLVKNIRDGQTGVVIDDLPGMLSVCGPDEVMVVYDGTTFGQGTDFRLLEITGLENAIADLGKCGAGKGAECCRFLTVGGDGAACERFGNLRNTLIFRKMGAKRDPAESFPACQIF